MGQLSVFCFQNFRTFSQVDQTSHPFEQSNIVIKAWCYYESRILGIAIDRYAGAKIAHESNRNKQPMKARNSYFAEPYVPLLCSWEGCPETATLQSRTWR